MAKTDKGLLFFYDWKIAFEALSGDDCKALLLAMLDYKQNGTQPPEFEGSAKIAAAFIFPAIDRSMKCADAGRSGGLKTQELKADSDSASSDASTTKQNKTETRRKQNKTCDDKAASPQSARTRHKYGQYSNVLLTDEEYTKLQAEFPSDYPERIERLSEYIASTGKSYKSHLATIRSWARKDTEKQHQQQQSDGWDYIYAVAKGETK